jgi:hypothetical protein
LVLGASAQIDNAAHIGGLAGGFVMGFVLSRPLQAERAARNWSRQWLTALLIVALAGATLSYFVGHKANSAIRSLAGFKLGTTVAKLIQLKGQPIKREGQAWIYSAGSAQSDGFISAILTSETNGSVRAVLYDGDRSSAPPELPYLRGMSKDDVVKQYGRVLATKDDQDGSAWIIFDNGVGVFLVHAIVRSYGIYDTSQ